MQQLIDYRADIKVLMSHFVFSLHLSVVHKYHEASSDCATNSVPPMHLHVNTTPDFNKSCI
jgi:hypothetical protein